MTLTIDLPPELETELKAEADRLHMPLAEYVVFAIDFGRPPNPMPRNGAEMVAYWEREGLLGTRTDIKDPVECVRNMRDKIEKREL